MNSWKRNRRPLFFPTAWMSLRREVTHAQFSRFLCWKCNSLPEFGKIIWSGWGSPTHGIAGILEYVDRGEYLIVNLQIFPKLPWIFGEGIFKYIDHLLDDGQISWMISWYLIPWLASGSVRQEPIQTRPIESQWNAESSNYTVILHAFETSFQIERSAPRLPQTTHAGDSAVDDLKGLCGPCNFGTGSGAHPFYFSLENFISERGKSGSSILLFLGMFPSIATMR